MQHNHSSQMGIKHASILTSDVIVTYSNQSAKAVRQVLGW